MSREQCLLYHHPPILHTSPSPVTVSHTHYNNIANFIILSTAESGYKLQVFSVPAAEWAELLDEKNTDHVSTLCAACDCQVITINV